MAAVRIQFEQISSLSSATKLTVPSGANGCTVQAGTQNIRFRMDGTDPTSSVGQRLLTTMGPLHLSTEQMHAARFIEESGGAELNVHYFLHGPS